MNQNGEPVNLVLPPLDHALPIHFIGDSNALAYRFQTLSSPQFFARPIVTVAQYFSGFTAHDSYRENALHPEFERYMTDPIFSRGVRGRHERRGMGPNLVALQISAGREIPIPDEFNYQFDPVVVLCTGALDAAWILSELGPGADFHLDDPRFEAAAFDPQPHTRVPYDAVLDLCKTRLAPLGLALRSLVDVGFDRMYVRNVHPPTLDDVQYFRMRRVLSSAVQRYKVTILVNRVLRQIALDAGARFLDTWDETTRGGLVRPEHIYDADHLNRAAAEIAIRKLLADLIARRSVPLDADERFDLA